MSNRFEASTESTQQTADTNYWTAIAADSQRRQTNQQAPVAPWLPSYEFTTQSQAQNAARDTTGRPGATAEKLTTSDTTQFLQNQRTQSPFDLISAAESSLQTNGMTADTKALYQKAIAAADSLYNPQDLTALKTLTDVLTTGKKVDGTEVAPAERMMGHRILNTELQAAQLGVQFRLSYAAMLQKTHQFATCESVLKDAVTAADRMPLDLIQKEQQLLQKDSSNPSLSREQQIMLGEAQKDFIGNKSIQQPGFAYLPTLARLDAAAFYVSAQPREDHKTPNGVLKPELALSMLDSAKNSYQQMFHADLSKKGTDPLYDAISETATMMLPENLKKQKENTDGFWSNTAIDLGVGALTIGAAFLLQRVGLGELAVRGGAALKVALATETGLTATGQIARAGLMWGGATAGRHYLHEWATGNSESWMTSTIHGGAGLAEISMISGVKGMMTNKLFQGATEEAALLRTAQVRGTEGTLTSGALKDLYTANKWTVPKSLSALDASTVIVKDGAVLQPLGLGLDAAKSAELVKAALAGPERNVVVRTAMATVNVPRSIGETVAAIVNPRQLDLATATARQISARGNAAGYVAALAGGEGYRAITALDRRYDTTTGERISYGQSFANNMLSIEPFTDALMMMPFVKPGAMPANYYQEGAGAVKNAWSSVRNVFSHLGPSGAAAQSENAMLRTAASAAPVAMGTARFWQGLMSKSNSDAYQDLLDQQAGR
jgi:hypothetical protein